MYGGARVQQAPVPGSVLPRDVVGADFAQGAQNVARSVDEAARGIVRLSDEESLLRDTLELDRIRDEMSLKAQQCLAAADGDSDSWYTEEGVLKQEALREFLRPYAQRLEKIGTRVIDPEMRQRIHFQAAQAWQGVQSHLTELGEKAGLARRQKLMQDKMDLAVARGDFAQAALCARLGAEAGYWSRPRAEAMALRFAQRVARGRAAASRAGEPASFSFGGQEYSGASAVLAAQAAREGVLASPSSEETPDIPQPAAETQVPQGEGTPPQEEPPQKSEENTPGGLDGALTLRVPPLSPASQLFETGDFSGVCKAMPLSEFDKFQDDLAYDLRLAKTELPDGRSSFSCSPFAPECVQRVAARAEQTGELSPDDIKNMIARITLDTCYQNSAATVANTLELFKDSGIFETLGNGDAKAGESETRKIVSEWLERSQYGTRKMTSESIEKKVEEHLVSPSFGAGREWKEMETIGKLIGDASKWKKDERHTREWEEGYRIYKKYRADFDPSAEGEITESEWQKNAPEFAQWYKETMYRKLKALDLRAAKDWYMGRISEALVDALQPDNGGKAEYQGYANDIRLVKAALEQKPPVDLGADALLESEIKRQDFNAKESKLFRDNAAADYARLSAMKADFAANSEKAKKAMDREKKAEEKREQAEEKRQEAIAARKLAVERARPRNREWAWDNNDAADGASPACTIPEEDYRELVENLGYDGTQEIYLRVNGGSVQVVGTNKSGRIELNTPAALKVQKKPNKKRGETWRLKGSLGYSYQLRNVR